MTVKTQGRAVLPQTPCELALAIAQSFFNEGSYAEAREVVTSALESGEPFNEAERFKLQMNLAMVEQWAGNVPEAFRIYDELAARVDALGDDQLAGKFYGNFAFALRRSGAADSKDRAILMLTGATYHFERAGDFEQYCRAINNLGVNLVDAGRFDEAHQHFDRAVTVLQDVRDKAWVNESKAAAYLVEGEASRNKVLLFKALDLSHKAVKMLQDSDRLPLLEKCLETVNRSSDALKRLYKLDAEKPQIEAALRATGGKRTATAKILGMSGTTLDWKLENQHPDLLHLRAEKKQPRGMHAPKNQPSV